MSTAPIITDLQKVNPSAIIELFTITLTVLDYTWFCTNL